MKVYCICGGKKWETRRGITRLVPCFWHNKRTGCAQVGSGPLGELHPICLLALGLFGLLDHESQKTFENEFRMLLAKRTQRYKTVEALCLTLPSPFTTQPYKGVEFKPTSYIIFDNEMPQSFCDNIMQIILTACQVIKNTMTLDDLDDGRIFEGTLRSLQNTIYSEDQFTFIEEMRGISPMERAAERADREAFGKHDRLEKTRTALATTSERKSIFLKGKRRRIHHELAMDAKAAFSVSNEAFDKDRIIYQCPIDPTVFGIDENWTPREGIYTPAMHSRITNQAQGGLIVSEAILKLGKHYAMSATLVDPLGSDWKKVNGQQGILVSAKTLQERAGMFTNMTLKKLDTHLWFSLCFKKVLDHIRIKIHGSTSLAHIPDGTVIYMALLHTNSVYYQNLKTFGSDNYGCSPNHALYAIHSNGPFVIPNQWVKFEYCRGTTPSFELLPYTQPDVTNEDFVDVKYT